MSTVPTGPDFPPLTGAESSQFRQLAWLLRYVGVGLIVCSVCSVALAFGGYDTSRSVNGSLLLTALVFFVLGGGIGACGRALARAVATGDKHALVAAIIGLKNLALVALFLVSFSTVGLVVRTVTFFAHVARGDYGWTG